MNVFRIIFVYFLATQFAWADMCDYFYRMNTNNIHSPDISLVKKLNVLDDLTLRLKKFSTGKKSIETQLLKGDAQVAIDKYSRLFRNVESSALYVKNYEIISKAIQKGIKLDVKDYERLFKELKIPQYLIDEHVRLIYLNGPEEYLPLLMKKMRKQLKVLGNNFYSYKSARGTLDSLASSNSCNAKCQKAIIEVYSTIGITAKPERALFNHLVRNRKNIKLSMVEKVFQSNPQSLVIAKKKEFLNQSLNVLKKFYSSTVLMNKLFNYLGTHSAAKGMRTVKMFKRIFDSNAFVKHNKLLTKVAYADLPVKDKYRLLEDGLGELNKNTVLADMFRHSDNKISKSFQDIKLYASKAKSRKPLLDQLESAEVLGKKIGPMSIKEPTGVGRLITFALISGAAITYFSFDTENEQIGGGSSSGDIQVLEDSTDVDDLTPEQQEVPLDDNEPEDDGIIVLKENSSLDNELYEELKIIIDTITPILD